MRFDDSLDTVLTADMSTAFGAQTAWRQLVDLIGRGRAPASDIAIARLRSIRPQVPATIRAASARALAFARPPAPLVRLFAEEDLAISAPVLRMADLTTTEWIAMLPDMSSAGRSVLRHRRDLSAEVGRALETYGPIDFILPAAEKVPFPAEVEALPVINAAPIADVVFDPEPIAPPIEPIAELPIEVPAPVVEELAADVVPESAPDATPSPIAEDDAPWMPLAANDVDPASEPVEARTEMPVGDASTIIDQVPEPEPEPVHEPLSIDWTAVIAARPKEPGDAAFKPRPLNLPANPSAYAPRVRAPLPTPASTPIVPVLAPAITLAPPVIDYAPPVADEAVAAPATPVAEAAEQVGAWSFVSIASVAFGLPVVVEALRQQDRSAASAPAPDVTAEAMVAPDADDSSAPSAEVMVDAPIQHPTADEPPVVTAVDAEPAQVEAPSIDEPTEPAASKVAPRGPFQISDLVARIDAFQRLRDEEGRADADAAIANDTEVPLPAPEGFSFETDARGVILWVSGVSRAALIGASLDSASHHAAQVDGVAAGAFRRRSPFAQARLVIAGQSDAAGQWRISGVPTFDKATGRFTGYRGTARRPRADERAEPQHAGRSPATDSLRQLVHELRTPTTAIAGFAEMIEGELLGPVSGPYRDYAGTIRDQAMGLLGAIDDLDTAARIEAHALDLRPTDVPVALLLQRIALDLEPLAEMRGTALSLDIAAGDVAIRGDDRAVERLFARLLAALVAAGSTGESIAVRMGREGEETVAIHIDRPRALAAYAGDALLTIDAEAESEATGAPLLGTGFALRLARNLAVELGGSLTIGVDRLTLRLPAAFTHSVGQASTI